MSINFNGVALGTGEGWTDTSIISLVGSGEPRRTIVVTRGPIDRQSLPDYAKAESKELRRSTKRYVLHAEGPFKVDQQEGYFLDHSFQSDALRIRQLQVFLRGSQLLYAFAATCEESAFESQRAELTRIAESLRVP